MLFRIFTLTFEPGTERFDDMPVRDYIADKDVEGIEHQFFLQESCRLG